MLRYLMAVLFALVLVPALQAEEIRGQITGVDATKSTITVKVGDKTRTLDVAKDFRLQMLVSSGGRRGRGGVSYQQFTGNLNNLGQGAQVTLTTQTRDDVEVVTTIRTDSYGSGYGFGGGRRRR